MRTWIIVSFMVLAACVGGSFRPGTRVLAAEPERRPVVDTTIALLGDVSASALLETIALEFGTRVTREDRLLTLKLELGGHRLKLLAPASTKDLERSALIAFRADLALLTVDGTQGPLPIVREHVLLARQFKVPTVGIIFTNASTVLRLADGKELLDLEELEVREVMKRYTLPADTALCMMDCPKRRRESEDAARYGLRDGLTALASMKVKKRKEDSHGKPTTAVTASVYVMTRSESAYAKPVENGCTLEIYINGQHLRTVVQVANRVELGENASLRLSFDRAVPAAQGDRFVIAREDHVVGAGFVE